MNDKEFAQLARDVFESIGGMVITDMDGRIVYINEKWSKRLGPHSPEELVGRPVEDVLPYTKMKIIADRLKGGEAVGKEIEASSDNRNVRNRMIVYRDGNRRGGEPVGVVAFDIIDSQQGQSAALRAMEYIRMQNELYQGHMAELYSAEGDPDDIMGKSSRMRVVKGLISKVAPSGATVCILGETGTGKELVANAIHKLSRRADKPFVKINCAAIPKDLMESELFGYEPGAFTGASRQGKMGKFEVANGGTLLLDEIGEMPLNLQAKLLRVIQSQEVERVGGTRPVHIDVRLLCSTNRNLRKMVEKGEFRTDLYYRINTVEVKVPPLRERVEDIPMLVTRFIEEFNRKNGLSVEGISDGAMNVLFEYDWPGNVRELENAIERACIMCGAGELDMRHFAGITPGRPVRENMGALYREGGYSLFSGDNGEEVREGKGQTVERSRFARSLLLHDEAQERNKVLEALTECKGNRTAAADRLGVARSTLYLKLKKYGLE